MKHFVFISLSLTKLCFVCGIDDIILERTLEVMDSVKLDSSNRKWNFVCQVSLAQFKHIQTAHLNSVVRVNQNNPTLPGENIVFCANDNKPKVFLQLLRVSPNHAVKNTWLVVGSSEATSELMKQARIRVNQCVLYFNSDFGTLEEVYWTGGQSVKNTLAKMVTMEGTGKLHWIKEKHILKRRSDLQGLLLKATVHRNWAPLSYHTDWLFNNMKYVKDSKGALVHHVANNESLGTLPDIINILQEDTNFTTERTVRKDEDIGFPIVVNGTFRGFSGMIGDLHSKDIDLMISPVVRTIEYHGIMTFFHRMSTLTTGLFVSAAAGQEDQDWLTYLLPFQYQLWILLLLNSLVAVMAIKLVHFLSFDKCNNAVTGLMEALSDFWMVLLSYFGKPSQSNLWWNVRSSKILILIIFLSGNLVFMTYKSALTSELAVRRQFLPFHSAKEFYESDFTLIFSWDNIEQVFQLYKDYEYMQWLSKKYYEQDDKISRDNFATSLDELVQPYSNKGYFNYIEKSTLYPNYMCQVSLAVQLSYPAILTNTVRKGSPYFEIINYALLKRMESGFLAYLNVKHNGKKIPCPLEVKGSPLGAFKLFGSYALFITGIGLSLIILVMENIHIRSKIYDLNDDDDESLVGYPTNFDLALHNFCVKWGPDTRYYRIHFKQDLMNDINKFMSSRK